MSAPIHAFYPSELAHELAHDGRFAPIGGLKPPLNWRTITRPSPNWRTNWRAFGALPRKEPPDVL